MKLTITINLDNAAFADDPDEVTRILADVARRLRGVPLWEDSGAIAISDANGNHVGAAEITV